MHHREGKKLRFEQVDVLDLGLKNPFVVFFEGAVFVFRDDEQISQNEPKNWVSLPRNFVGSC